jgi:hypothetical protein
MITLNLEMTKRHIPGVSVAAFAMSLAIADFYLPSRNSK